MAEFVSKFLECQHVKAPRQKQVGLLQPLTVPEWKWENVSMDSIVGLLKTAKGHTVIWVIVDRLTKSTHFIPGKSTFSVSEWAQIYIKEVVRLHGVSIVSDKALTSKRCDTISSTPRGESEAILSHRYQIKNSKS